MRDRRAGAAGRRVEAVCARWDLACHRDRRGHRRRAACAAAPTARSSATCRSRRWSTTRRATRCTPARPAAGAEPVDRAGRRARRRDDPADAAARCWPRPTSPAGAGSTSSTTSWSARARSSGPGGDAGVVRLTPSGARSRSSLDGNGRARLARSAPRRRGGGLRGGAQRGLHGRAAGGRSPNCLNFGNPETRRDRLRLARGDRGHGRGLRGARHAGRFGQRLALQRELRHAHPPDAGGRLRGRAGRRRAGACDGRLPARRRRRAAGRRRRAALDGSEYQSWCAGEVAGRIPDVDLAGRRGSATVLADARRAAACCARATTSPTAASRSRWPSRRSRAACGVAASRRPAAGRGRRRRSSARAAAVVVVTLRARPTRRAAALAGDAAGVPSSIGAVGGDGASRCACGDARSRCRSADARRGLRARQPLPQRDGGRLMCGVFGIYAPGPRRRPAHLLRASTRCSTAARRAPASPSPTAAA